MEILNALQSIGFDWQLAVAHLVNFLIVLALLNYFVFDPVSATLKERRETIDQGLKDAKQAEKDRFAAKETKKRLVTEGRQKKQEIIAEAKDEAEAIAEDVKAEAKKDAEAIIEQGKKDVANERESMLEDLREETAGLATKMAEKILRREADTDDQDRLVKEVVSQKYE
jgi:F-type H+-transporting ATPase subunit b